MAISKKEIQKSNRAFYCNTYSIVSAYRKWNNLASCLIVIWMGVVLLLIKRAAFIFIFRMEARNQVIPNNQEVSDWVYAKLAGNRFNRDYVVIIGLTLIMLLVVCLTYRVVKSYELHKYKKRYWIPGAIWVACCIYIAMPCFKVSFSVGGILALSNLLPVLGAFKLLLPAELKAPFEFILNVFDGLLRQSKKDK